MLLQAPCTPRDTFKLFGHLVKGSELSTVLDRVDWKGVTAAQLQYAVFGRPLPRSGAKRISRQCSAMTRYTELLNSDEFQRESLRLLVQAFDEKRREIFLHIPKCAGTDLIANISPFFPSAKVEMTVNGFHDTKGLFSIIREFVHKLSYSDTVFVAGHFRLEYLLEAGLYRYTDDLFTTVRDPLDVALSHINYIIKVLLSDREIKRPDSKLWLKDLGVTNFPEEPDETFMLEFAKLIIQHPKVIWGSRLCSMLGDGTLEGALDMMNRCRLEITDTSNYPAWLERKFGIRPTSRLNTSVPYIKRENLDKAAMGVIEEKIQEDRHLYSMIRMALEKAGTISVFGSQVDIS